MTLALTEASIWVLTLQTPLQIRRFKVCRSGTGYLYIKSCRYSHRKKSGIVRSGERVAMEIDLHVQSIC